MNKKQIVVGALTAIIGILLVSGIVVEKRLTDLRSHLDSRISQQSTVVRDIAMALSQNTTNDVFIKIVPECNVAEATVYETLLSSLDKGLSAGELSKLAVLFDKCGGVVAARRAGMSLTLQNQTNLLKELVAERHILGDYSSEESKFDRYVELSEVEDEISNQFMKLVEAQKQIIAALLTGVSQTTVSVEMIRTEAQKVRQELERLTAEVLSLRTELLTS